MCTCIYMCIDVNFLLKSLECLLKVLKSLGAGKKVRKHFNLKKLTSRIKFKKRVKRHFPTLICKHGILI